MNPITKIMVRIVKVVVLLVVSGLYHTLNFAAAQYFPGPTGLSLGGAGVAGFKSSESVLLNPASVVYQPFVDVALYYTDGNVQKGVNQTRFGVSIVDNSEDVVFPGGISYFRGSRNFYGVGAEEQLWLVSLGKAMGPQWSLGFNIAHLTSSIKNLKEFKQLAGSFGLLYSQSSLWALGFVYEHGGDPDALLPVAFRLHSRTQFGFKLQPQEIFAIYFDVSRQENNNPDKKMAFHSGVESFTNAFTVLRLGMKWDNFARQNFVSFGLGFDGPRLKANYSFQKALKGTGGALHGVDFRVHF